MSRLWIDRLGNGQRRSVMFALRTGPSIGALAVGGGLTSLAVASGMFGIFGLGKYLLESKRFATVSEREIIAASCRNGDLTEAPARLQQMGHDIAVRFGEAAPVKVLVGDINEPAMVIRRTIVFNKTAVKILTPEEKKFVMAHEMAHIKAGDTSRKFAAISTVALIENGLVGLGSAGFMQIFAPLNLPGMIAGLSLGAAGLFVGRVLAKKYESRSIERCRDFEALQKTGDLTSAISSLKKMTPSAELINPPGKIARLFKTHPAYKERVLNLRDAYVHAVESGVIRPDPPMMAALHHLHHHGALEHVPHTP